MSLVRILVCILIVYVLIPIQHSNAQAGLSFDWLSVAGNPNAFGVNQDVFGGSGPFTAIQGLPITESIVGNPPTNFTYFFANQTFGLPALELSSIDFSDASNTLLIVEYQASPGSFFELRNQENVVAVGQILDVTILNPPSQIATGFGRVQLTGSGGGDATIFNELLAASQGTGILSFSLSCFQFSGFSSDFPGLEEFSSDGSLVLGEQEGTTPNDPVMPMAKDGSFEFDIPDLPENFNFWCDPEVTIGYEFVSETQNLRAVTLPDIGDGMFDLELFNGSEYQFETQLVAGEQYFFSGGSVNRFRIMGIEESASIDPNDVLAFVVGLTFSSGGALEMTPITCDQVLLGDVNLDGSVDLLDVAAFVQVLTNGDFQLEADIDQNGTVDLLDVGPFVDILSNP